MTCRGTTWWNNVLSWLVVGIVISTSTWPFVHAKDSVLPQEMKYVHLWASQDGETHIAQCKLHNFTYEVYGLLPQYVKIDIGVPTKVAFSELPVNFTQGLHNPPAVQFVVVLAGSWYVATTDGSEYTFTPGEVLFQDNTRNSPADKVPQHYSGVNGTVPCQQFFALLNTTAQVDNPCPF